MLARSKSILCDLLRALRQIYSQRGLLQIFLHLSAEDCSSFIVGVHRWFGSRGSFPRQTKFCMKRRFEGRELACQFSWLSTMQSYRDRRS